MRLFDWMRREKAMRPLYSQEVQTLSNGTREERRQAYDSLKEGLNSEITWVRRAAVVALESSGVGQDLLREYHRQRTWQLVRPTLFQRARRCLFSLTDIPAYIDVELGESDGEVTATVKGSPVDIVVTLEAYQLLPDMLGNNLYAEFPDDDRVNARIISLIKTAADTVLAKDALSRLSSNSSYRDFKKVMEELRDNVKKGDLV